jgi:hypothetical protein
MRSLAAAGSRCAGHAVGMVRDFSLVNSRQQRLGYL